MLTFCFYKQIPAVNIIDKTCTEVYYKLDIYRNS